MKKLFPDMLVALNIFLFCLSAVMILMSRAKVDPVLLDSSGVGMTSEESEEFLKQLDLNNKDETLKTAWNDRVGLTRK